MDESGSKYEITRFAVRKSWKGQLAGEIQTRIIVECCLCGAQFEDDREYLLFLTGPDIEGFFSTNICALNRRAEDSQEEQEVLNSISNELGQ